MRDCETWARLLLKSRETLSDLSQEELYLQAISLMSSAIPYGVKGEFRTKIVNNLIEIVLILLSRNFVYNQENLQKINSIISKLSFNLTFPDLQNFYITILMCINTDIRVWDLYEVVHQDDYYLKEMDFRSVKCLASHCESVCSKCGVKLNHRLDEIILFNCSHACHIGCMEINKCPICLKSKELDSRALLRRPDHRGEVQVRRSPRHQEDRQLERRFGCRLHH